MFSNILDLAKVVEMTTNPKVSIITISYNAEDYIERTIKSVVKQTYDNIEYIVIDGASKDKTVDLIKQYEEHIDLWISEPDKSHFDAMNKGLTRATGDYVLFMNAGDCINEADSLERMMKDSNDADFIYADAIFIDEEGNTRPWHKKTPRPDQLSARSFLNGMVICHHCMIVRRTMAPEYRLEPWKVSNDIEWAIRVMKNVKTYHFSEQNFCLYLEGGISEDARRKAIKERFDITRTHFGLAPTVLEQFKIVFQAMLRRRID